MYVRPSGIRPAGDAAYLPDFGCCFHGSNPDDSGQERTLDADGNGDLLRYADHDDFLLTVLPVAYLLLFSGSTEKRKRVNALEKQ